MSCGRLVLWLGLMSGCVERSIDLGSNTIWRTSSESGTLDEWFAEPGGGLIRDSGGLEPTVTTTARSGQFGLLLASPGDGVVRGVGAWRPIAQDGASYAAWFMVPDVQEPNDLATILLFAAPQGTAPAPGDTGLRVQLRTLPSGEHVLQVYDDPRPYRGQPLPDPPPVVVSGRWFHVEARLTRSAAGRFDVWLNGRHVYRVVPPEPLDFGAGMYFAVVCDVEDRAVGPYRLFVDEIVIAASRVPPEG